MRWEWDDRFEVALAAFSTEHEARVSRILGDELRATWLASTVANAPAFVHAITRIMGLRSGQKLFATDDDGEAMVFCAWWPWGGGKTISLRIGVVTAEAAAHAASLRSWFDL